MKLMYEIRKLRPDIIHVQGINLSPYLISMLLYGRKSKKVITVHSYPTKELIGLNELKYNTPKYYFLRWLEKRGLNDSDLLICVTNVLKDWALEEQKNGRSKQIMVMPNSVDLSTFRPVRKPDARHRLGISGDDFIIFHAKEFWERNGQRYLIQAMPRILERIPGAKLYLAGDGPTMPEMQKLIKDLSVQDNVVLLGYVSNLKIPDYLAASDVVCIPSIRVEGLEEGSSIFLIEAMAMEKPCVASNIGGLAESIENGVTGLLIPDKEAAAISSAVIRLYDDPALSDAIGKNARRYVERERNWGALTNRLLRMYESIVN
jgi:glycosyltransferase involved in cell wall biosynthesis